LNAAIDCCVREIAGWALDVCCRAREAIAVIDHAIATREVGSPRWAPTRHSLHQSRIPRPARRARRHPPPRRHRHPESQAFNESWFSKRKLRCIWREEFETLEAARTTIGAYIGGYHHRPHTNLAYRTPSEFARTRKDRDDHLTPAA
jgi:putative transposase